MLRMILIVTLSLAGAATAVLGVGSYWVQREYVRGDLNVYPSRQVGLGLYDGVFFLVYFGSTLTTDSSFHGVDIPGFETPWAVFPREGGGSGTERGIYWYELNYLWNFCLRVTVAVPCVLFLLYPTLAFICGPLLRWRRRNRGLCVHCGYDQRGNPMGVCPECGGSPHCAPGEAPAAGNGATRGVVLLLSAMATLVTLIVVAIYLYHHRVSSAEWCAECGRPASIACSLTGKDGRTTIVRYYCGACAPHTGELLIERNLCKRCSDDIAADASGLCRACVTKQDRGK